MRAIEAWESRRVAEAARETKWQKHSFLRDLFMGSFHADVLRAKESHTQDRPEFTAFFERLKLFLIEHVDPVVIDEGGEYPPEVLQGLAKIGAFGMKIGTQYGGLGFTQREYERAMELVGSYDANVTALLSAHQSIGLPQPLKLFGTDEQKLRYLPRCARGAISAFALTEAGVGSDPARICTVAEPSADGGSYVLNGTKLWCTNGTLAELLVVMALTPPHGISAFIVEAAWTGVSVKHRCRFMGLRALANAELEFHDVVVPRANLIGAPGQGLKVALVTLNAGRLSLPAATTGEAKACLEVSRKWSEARVQWGHPIGEHETVTHKLADMASTAFAMESVADFAADLADQKGQDIRLEAAAAKEWNATRGWQIVDEALAIRGGRGFETERSLAARGEVPIGIERAMRDSRVNRIFEGSSEIMHLFMAREAVDDHLRVVAALIGAGHTRKEKLEAGARGLAFYARWYPRLWLQSGAWPRFREFGALARHVRFIEATSRKLARSVFHGMVVHGAGLEQRQAFLFRVVDVAIELFAMSAAIRRAHQMAKNDDDASHEATRLADLFCRTSRRSIADLFHSLWRNDDSLRSAVGLDVLRGKEAWLETGIVGLGKTADELRPAAPLFGSQVPPSGVVRTSNGDGLRRVS